MILRDLQTRSQGRLRSDRRVPTILNLILNVKSPPSFDPPVVVRSWETRKRYLSLLFFFSFLFLFFSFFHECKKRLTRVPLKPLITSYDDKFIVVESQSIRTLYSSASIELLNAKEPIRVYFTDTYLKSMEKERREGE